MQWFVNLWYLGHTVDERNPANHPGCIKPVVKNGINYQPSLVSRIFSINSMSHLMTSP